MYPEKAEKIITELLTARLSPDLFYHNLYHTKSVVSAALEIASEEGIKDEQDLFLLATAAWFHDAGYINVYEKHEEESCKLAMELLPAAGYTQDQIHTVCTLIMKTHVPQLPETLLEKILCDADLDYLGRSEFSRMGSCLMEEWKVRGKVNNASQFNKMQIGFLEKHRFWTKTSQTKREPLKAQHLQKLREMSDEVTK
jgi:uncharacterized protein